MHTLFKISSFPVRICSENNFPTAAGLASSASGFAALVATLASLYSLQPTITTSELSRIARQGSGSACRSLFGGFVAWQGGETTTGEDSLAIEVAPKSHWSDLQALICVVSDAKKGTPSTAGMQRTVQTSPFLQRRIQDVVPLRMKEITQAIQEKNFDKFARITMDDSNNFHACCLDTSPPIFYMNDTSRNIVQLVEEVNRASKENGGGNLLAYTFDAGPNAVIYVMKENMPMALQLIRHYFPNTEFDDTVSWSFGFVSLPPPKLALIIHYLLLLPFQFNLLGAGANASHRGAQSPVDLPTSSLPKAFNSEVIPVREAGAVRRLIHTQVGDGPRVMEQGQGKESLLKEDGTPLRLTRNKKSGTD